MNSTIFGIFFLVVTLALLFAFVKRYKPRPLISPYERKLNFLSNAERNFFAVLDQSVGGLYRILAKVRVADLISVRRGIDKSAYRFAFNRIQSKHIDFVLCAQDTLEPICLIELDDRSHQKSARRDRDDFLDEICAVTALPLVRVPAKAAYNTNDLRNAIFDAIRGAVA